MEQKLNKIRHLKIATPHGILETPFFMPIATRGVVKGLTPEDLEKLRATLVLGNTYHLWLKPGLKVIKKFKGLHNFMHWPKPILTDSGGFQVFSLAKFRKITEEGVSFSEPDSGKKHFLTPEKSIDIQLALGSDIIMVLDECPPWPCSKKDVLKAVERTTAWAKRCKDHFDRFVEKKNDSPLERGGSPKARRGVLKNKRPLLFAIVQGGTHKDLRERSAKELVKIGFDGYAVGGVAVGEPREYLKKVLKYTLPHLPENKPRYLMGLGKPEEIIEAVKMGIDMFDCVIPTREGRHGRLFIRDKDFKNIGTDKKFKPEKTYRTINIGREIYALDSRKIDPKCDCYLCQNYSRSYLRHLFKIGDSLAMRLASEHNLRFYLEMMEKLR